MNKESVERLYNDVLNNHIIPMVGNGTTFMSQLNDAGKKLFKKDFIGVFTSDKIPLFKNGKHAILNLDNSTQPGSHWVAVSKHQGKLIVYDSFGRKTEDILPSLKDRNIKDTEYDREQKKSEQNCGARSLAALVLLDMYNPDEVSRYL